MTPQEIEANQAAILAALAEHGVTPEAALAEEGRQKAMSRVQGTYAKAKERGYEGLAKRLEGMAETEGRAYAGRQSRRGRGGTGSAPSSSLPPPEQMLGTFMPVQAPPPTPAPARMPSPENLLANYVPAEPSTFSQPGYRPTSGIAAGAQSAQEADDLAAERRTARMLTEISGIAPAYRSGKAFSEGDIIGGVGNAAVAAMPYKPLVGAGALGAAYAGALGADLLPGMVGSSRAQADEAGQPVTDPLAGDREMLKGLIEQQGTLRLQAEAARQRMETERRSGEGPRFKAAKDAYEAANIRATSMDDQVRELNKRLSPEAIQQQKEYSGAVSRAETARDEELARARRFQDTRVGKLFDSTGGYAPAVAGGLAGTVGRLATGGGKPFLYNYLLPAAEGGAAGAFTYNIPLAYDAFLTPVENPERRAYEAYARELPMNHPRRQEWMDYARSLPEANPVRTNASKEFYDPGAATERMLFGAGEGILGGLLGANAVRIGNRARGGGRPTPEGAPSGPTDTLALPAPQTGRIPPQSPGSANPAAIAGPSSTAPGSTSLAIWPTPTRYPGMGAPPPPPTPPPPPQDRLLSLREPPRGPSVIQEPTPPRPRSTVEQPLATLD